MVVIAMLRSDQIHSMLVQRYRRKGKKLGPYNIDKYKIDFWRNPFFASEANDPKFTFEITEIREYGTVSVDRLPFEQFIKRLQKEDLYDQFAIEFEKEWLLTC
jgi:hypothetical protein